MVRNCTFSLRCIATQQSTWHRYAPGLFTRSEDIPDPRFRFFCVECGAEIHGVPYLTAWYSICVCLDPYDFCSEECWNKNDLLNSANWPPPVFDKGNIQV